MTEGLFYFLIITDITQQKNNKKRYSVFIDNEFAFGIDETDMLYYKLKKNEEITEERYNFILENVVFAKCRDRAAKILSFGAKTEKELFERLKREDFGDEIIFKVLELLKKYGYIDDAAYARAFAADKFKLKGYGLGKIAYELKLKGISEEIINNALSESDFDENERAKELLIKKFGEITAADFKTKQKMYGFLMRRGYSYDIIKECISAVVERE